MAATILNHLKDDLNRDSRICHTRCPTIDFPVYCDFIADLLGGLAKEAIY
jgi:hypothetical protein